MEEKTAFCFMSRARPITIPPWGIKPPAAYLCTFGEAFDNLPPTAVPVNLPKNRKMTNMIINIKLAASTEKSRCIALIVKKRMKINLERQENKNTCNSYELNNYT